MMSRHVSKRNQTASGTSISDRELENIKQGEYDVSQGTVS